MKFYLGTHNPHWLRLIDVPLFVSRRRLQRYTHLPKAIGPWALDSGGFTELTMYGKWNLQPPEYAELIDRYAVEIGNLQWVSPQDWMCEPAVLEKTGLTVKEHQERTVKNVMELRKLATKAHVIPVLQGYKTTEYWEHISMYAEAGIVLHKEPVVGIGSICRRQGTTEIEDLVRNLYNKKSLKLHGFGVKLQGLRNIGKYLLSADSLSWSFCARKEAPLPGHTHKTCANCLEYALKWREKALQAVETRSGEEL